MADLWLARAANVIASGACGFSLVTGAWVTAAVYGVLAGLCCAIEGHLAGHPVQHAEDGGCPIINPAPAPEPYLRGKGCDDTYYGYLS